MLKHTKHFCMVIDRYTKEQIKFESSETKNFNNNLEMEIVVEHEEFDTASWYNARHRFLNFICKDNELRKMLDEKHAGWCIDSCELDDLSEYNKQLDRACGRG